MGRPNSPSPASMGLVTGYTSETLECICSAVLEGSGAAD